MNPVIGVLPLLLSVALSAQAADPVPVLSGAKRATALEKDPIALTVLADQIATLGESSNDPLAFILAAKIQKGLRIKEAEGAGANDSSRYTLFLERAKELAGDRSDYQAIIRSVEETSMRGTISGVSQHRGSLGAGASTSIKLSFIGGEDAGVALMVDASHLDASHRSEIDLDLYVRDQEGRAICALEGPGVPELCAWTPSTTGKFTAQVVNRGKGEVPFVLNFR